MIDTHTHLYLPQFENGGNDALERGISAGVSHFILPNVDSETLVPMKKLHYQYPDHTSMAIGLHPTEVKENWKEIIDSMEKELEGGEYVSVGEIGMDLYWDQTYIKEQKEAFSYQLKLAEKYRLPVIIHCRNALTETIEIINEVNPDVPLIFHSFTGGHDDVAKIREVCDPYFGINGVVTYKNAPELREALSQIGLSRLLLETDSPYLTPVPHRGKRNESAYLEFICEKIAETLSLKSEKVEKATDANAKYLFNL